KQNCERLGATIVVPEVKDARIPDEDKFSRFDKVLIDAPCSGLGVIRRKPDIKWSKKPEDIMSLRVKQQGLLKLCSNYVKPGGILIYSTCSIDPKENNEIIDRFLAKNEHFIYDDLRPYLPQKLHDDIKKPYGHITLYPNIHGTDGFFIARLKKVKA
ncbi:MAG: 16S rRNA (cytosine(967)-C(5))-methyltransferase RsmB, partial [Tepidanaerobacteraceae bacterium]|nr:16S rRNA (cytosine(967)-C(5))-methyltransferase RsmB [Tepidanaerobacteraceae bacterium]